MEQFLVDLLGADWTASLETAVAVFLTGTLSEIYKRVAPAKWESHSRLLRYGVVGLSAIAVGTLVLVLGGSPLTWAIWGPMALKAFLGAIGVRQLIKHGVAPQKDGALIPLPVPALGRSASIETKLPPRSP